MPTTEELPNELRDKNWLITDTQISAQQKNGFLSPKNVAKNVEDTLDRKTEAILVAICVFSLNDF